VTPTGKWVQRQPQHWRQFWSNQMCRTQCWWEPQFSKLMVVFWDAVTNCPLFS
jgi:hypothetical protein